MCLPNAEASTTEEPDAGKLHVRDCAGGRWVTGVPTVRANASVQIREYGKFFSQISYRSNQSKSIVSRSQKILDTNRGHWSVENCFFNIIDWNYNEDRSRLRTGNGLQNDRIGATPSHSHREQIHRVLIMFCIEKFKAFVLNKQTLSYRDNVCCPVLHAV
jgi:hypothetical protein